MFRTSIAGLLATLVLTWPCSQYDISFRSRMVRVPVAGHDLLVSQYEVTTASWNRCYSEGGCSHNAAASVVGGAFPVTGVNWFDVQEYLKWANRRAGGGLRLPTLAEWRVIDRTLAHAKPAPLFTDPRMAWAANYDQEKTADGPVRPNGSYSTTPEDISDLDGNVWEWTSSCFKSGFENDCPAYIVAGEHEAIVSVFVGEPAIGGCAAGTPPTHLGFRLVADR
jgi:formylglycine-generating enzyme required for sulfatase activity